MLSTLNGRAVSWAEILITLNVTGGPTVQSVDIKALNDETKVERGEQRGASGGRVMKRTTGALSNTASATFYRDGLQSLIRQLALVAPADSAGRAQISKVAFDIVIQHEFEDALGEYYCKKWLGCHLDKLAGKHEEGTDAETVDVDLNPLEIVQVVDGRDVVLL